MVILTAKSYWGQDGSGNQQDISAYCNDDSVDSIIIAFLTVFFGPDGAPEINLANVRIQIISDASLSHTYREQRYAARLPPMCSVGLISRTALSWLLR